MYSNQKQILQLLSYELKKTIKVSTCKQMYFCLFKHNEVVDTVTSTSWMHDIRKTANQRNYHTPGTQVFRISFARPSAIFCQFFQCLKASSAAEICALCCHNKHHINISNYQKCTTIPIHINNFSLSFTRCEKIFRGNGYVQNHYVIIMYIKQYCQSAACQLQSAVLARVVRFHISLRISRYVILYSCDCLSILTLLTLHVSNYTILLIALRLPVPVISDLKHNQSISASRQKIAPVSPYFPSS